MTGLSELGTFLGGLRVAVTIADEDYRIVFMNDLALEHYAAQGGENLIGTDLLDCHNAESQATLRHMYDRYRTGDLAPTRYHIAKQDGHIQSIVLIPLIVDGQFKGIAELLWTERPDLVFSK
ncbi:MAG TPA: PAS domain-containing protein [Anaerolineae bacterium]|nr:PAS domain-containing protein [Anaerolineae bacterium]